MKTFITSDHHFGHKMIIKYCNRPFETVHEMNKELIRAWNSVVLPEDEVYHLGDVSLTDPKSTEFILNQLNGKIYLIKGNHEKSVMKKDFTKKRFEWIKEKVEIEIDGILITLNHYSQRVWNRSHRGSFHCYGHSHSTLENEPFGKSMDVGVDNAYKILGEYRPFRWEEIKEILSKRPIKVVDHHQNDISKL